MKTILETLLQLQELDSKPRRRAAPGAASLRKRLPEPILLHYDRFRSRGRKALATVNANGVCRGCQMKVPVALVVALRRGDEIQSCGNCGRYLVLEAAPSSRPIHQDS